MDTQKYFIHLQKGTLHPPVLWRRPEDDDDAAAGIPWVLLDLEAYVADHRNATTAYSLSESAKEIQVTFFFARPPRFSYFCVFCPGRDHTEIPIEPKILAMDEGLVLLRIFVSPEKELNRDRDFYLYQANGAEDGGPPSLIRLPRLPGLVRCLFDYDNVGLLRCNEKTDFIVAALCDVDAGRFMDEGFKEREGQFALFVYNSKCQAWSVNVVSLDHQQLRKQPVPGEWFLHFNSKVITIGGEAGTMGFVDLWRGIILCDVLEGNPNLSYVPLPKPKVQGRLRRGEAGLHRDIAVIRGQIKYVELETTGDPSLFRTRRYANDGWMAWKYSRPVAAANSAAAANSSSDDWRMECAIGSSDDICVDDNPHLELLPRPEDKEGRPLPPFKGLAICHPALSLSGDGDDDTVYFMNKMFPGDDKAWVIAVNMRTKELLGVARFAAERTDVVIFTYAHSRISKYLTGGGIIY
ncbi:unnamed protein product [Urochloa decumbens]|uniref:DUF1618 domain-containing protein n=1 Tax=Urochloa decumbens TaxID=240449 RepID=A0ABC8WGY8_9POAL